MTTAGPKQFEPEPGSDSSPSAVVAKAWPDQTELEYAFERSPEDGVASLHRDFHSLLARAIKAATRGGLSAEELKDAYQETLIEVLQAARRPGFQAKQPLALAVRIGRCRGIDSLRRKRRTQNHMQTLQDHARLNQIDGASQATKLTETDKEEFRWVYCGLIEQLSKRQKMIAQLVMSNTELLQRPGKYQHMADELRRQSGQELSAEAVKSAWRQAKEKIARGMKKFGFTLDAKSEKLAPPENNPKLNKQAPDKQAPDKQAPDKQAPDKQAPDKQAPDKQALTERTRNHEPKSLKH